jgi:PAS domain S-box-containing protein
MPDLRQLVIQNVLENLPMGLVILNADGSPAVVNEAVTSILGCQASDIMQQGWGPVFFDGEKNIEFNQVLIDAIDQESPRITREVPYDHPNGDTRYLSVTSSFLTADSDEAAVILLIQDLTDLHEAFHREKTALEERNRIRSQQVQSLNKLARSVAHQLRNPMVSISGLARMAQRKVQAREIEDLLEGVREEAARLEKIVSAVSDYASLVVNTPKQVRLSAMLEQVRDWTEKQAAVLGRTLDWTTETDDITVLVDADLLERVFRELAMNSVERAGSPRVDIHIGASQSAEQTTIVMRDRGEGIPADELPYVFDPFYTTKPVGVGMGLAVAQRIMAEHGGDITLESREDDRGVKAVLTLPSQAQEE